MLDKWVMKKKRLREKKTNWKIGEKTTTTTTIVETKRDHHIATDHHRFAVGLTRIQNFEINF